MNTKLVLGTVQLGLNYGLNNMTGMPGRDESFAILDAAVAHGIELFDTAFAYGTSEDVLGDWITARSRASSTRVISKMKPHVLNDYPDGTRATDIVESEVHKSLARLHIESLDGYLLHSPYYMYLSHVVDGLRSAKEKGLTKNIGVSIYDVDEALHALDVGFDYIQVPFNALDQRLLHTDFFARAKQQNVTVFARSPFLQGLLLMKPENLPAHLLHAKPPLEKFIGIAEQFGMSQLEAALTFVLGSPEIGQIVPGVETVSQFKSLAILVERLSEVSPDFMRAVHEAFGQSDQNIVNPSLWSRPRK